MHYFQEKFLRFSNDLHRNDSRFSTFQFFSHFRRQQIILSEFLISLKESLFRKLDCYKISIVI